MVVETLSENVEGVKMPFIDPVGADVSLDLLQGLRFVSSAGDWVEVLSISHLTYVNIV